MHGVRCLRLRRCVPFAGRGAYLVGCHYAAKAAGFLSKLSAQWVLQK